MVNDLGLTVSVERIHNWVFAHCLLKRKSYFTVILAKIHQKLLC